jgi:putative nucleotidyltransferase with HDIG domain
MDMAEYDEPEQLAQVKGMLTRISRTGTLPTLPKVSTAALAFVRDPDANLNQLCPLIEADVGLAARVIRAANSPIYGRGTKVTSVRTAILTLGLRQTSVILMAAGARQSFPGGASAVRLWGHSLASAVAAEVLAKLTTQVKVGDAFLPALFHDVGRTVFLLADPEAFERIESLVDEGSGVRETLERGHFGLDHAEAGATLVAEWGFGPEVIAAVRWHHRPDARIRGAFGVLLRAADALAQFVAADCGPEGVDDEALLMLGVCGEDRERSIALVAESLAEYRQILG